MEPDCTAIAATHFESCYNAAVIQSFKLARAMMKYLLSLLLAATMSLSLPAIAAPEAVSGTVSLSPELADKVAPTDTVFILVRAAQGPRMPIAVYRKQVKDLPLNFMLDDSMSMQPRVKISNFSEVKVAARISKSGSAVTRPGDYEGVSPAIKPGTSGVDIVIDTLIVSDSKTSQSL